MIKKTTASVLLIVFLFFPLAAQETENTGKKEEKESAQQAPENTPLFKSVLQDQGHFYSSPLRLKGKDFALWGGVVLVTGILIANDVPIYKEIKEFQLKHKWVSDVSPTITRLGLGEWTLGTAGAFYLGGLIFKDPKAKETARLTLMTFIHTGFVVQLGKHLTGRQRPSWGGTPKNEWHWFKGFFNRYKDGQLAQYDAFPAGHVITIFGTATVISEMYKNTVWVPILCYSVATLSGLSRITEDTHWLSDVFLGAVLGYAIGKYVVKTRNRLQKLNIYPIAGSRQVGLSLNYVF